MIENKISAKYIFLGNSILYKQVVIIIILPFETVMKFCFL